MTLIPTHLAAYGTLKQEFGRWPSLGMEECRVVGTVPLKGRLYNLGWFPGLVPTEEGEVTAELIELNGSIPRIERALDRYEGAPDFFGKSVVQTVIEGKIINVLQYYWQNDLPNDAKEISAFTKAG